MPANMYFSGSLGLCSLSGTEDMDGSSKTGFAFDATVGKEWWVSNDLGLGLSGNVSYFSAKDDTFLGTTESFSGPSFGTKDSATFNCAAARRAAHPWVRRSAGGVRLLREPVAPGTTGACRSNVDTSRGAP